MARAGRSEPLTRKAVARLARRTSCLRRLVDIRVSFAKRARRFYVGKRAGRHAMTQTAIHALMIRAARKGQCVVRLKGGDPFVFGRGGEEALALRAAGVPYDIVPGVTSAVAAPELAGIPVTHRGLSSAFSCRHDATSSSRASAPWRASTPRQRTWRGRLDASPRTPSPRSSTATTIQAR